MEIIMKKGLERDISIEEKEITYYQFFEKDWKDFKAQRLVPNNSKWNFHNLLEVKF